MDVYSCPILFPYKKEANIMTILTPGYFRKITSRHFLQQMGNECIIWLSQYKKDSVEELRKWAFSPHKFLHYILSFDTAKIVPKWEKWMDNDKIFAKKRESGQR